jgi:hypothetical protein
LNLWDDVTKVFHVGLLDGGSIFHHDSGQDDLEILGIVEVTRAVLVLVSSEVLVKQLVSRARVKLVQDESVLIEDS